MLNDSEREQIKRWALEVSREALSVAKLVDRPGFEEFDARGFADHLDNYAVSIRRLFPEALESREERLVRYRDMARRYPNLRPYYSEKISGLLKNEAGRPQKES